jgi:hypothetical protein
VGFAQARAAFVGALKQGSGVGGLLVDGREPAGGLGLGFEDFKAPHVVVPAPGAGFLDRVVALCPGVAASLAPGPGRGFAFVFSRRPVQGGHGLKIAFGCRVGLLLGQGSGVDPVGLASPFKSVVYAGGHLGAHGLEFRRPGLEVVVGFGRVTHETVRPHLAAGHQQVSMKIAVIAALVGRMESDEHGDAVAVYKQLPNLVRQVAAGVGVQFVRQR